ncbi:tyrosine--tRNA ligase [Buchnera aphidicola (Hormaphis cornu)]|nr:tyrosine--tRNA ligase [Buchnera aphidicola (Hormaphis cornu)]
MINNIIDKLKKKGLISQITNECDLMQIVAKNRIALYCGFDPTADSLHIGHLLPLLCLRHFQLLGHTPIVLIGGATSLIGDPSFKDKLRDINFDMSNIKQWENKIINQISLFLDFNCGNNSAIIVNNYEWLSKLNFIQFLRNIGGCFSVNSMINRKSVRERVNRPDQGISFAEFSYSLLQAYDFYFLYKKYNAILQIGGSDQWGNITSGIRLTYKLIKKKVYGLTVPLLIQSNGNKFGKTEQGTIWLDKRKTSTYRFYQFWMNISDTDVLRYLKLFTFLNTQDIENITKINQEKNNPFYLQRILAEEITKLVHGKEDCAMAIRLTRCLFSEKINNLKLSDFIQLKKDHMFSISVRGLLDLKSALVASFLASSKSQAHAMIISKSIRINNKVQDNYNYYFLDSDKIFMKFTLLSRGKKNHCLLCW